MACCAQELFNLRQVLGFPCRQAGLCAFGQVCKQIYPAEESIDLRLMQTGAVMLSRDEAVLQSVSDINRRLDIDNPGSTFERVSRAH